MDRWCISNVYYVLCDLSILQLPWGETKTFSILLQQNTQLFLLLQGKIGSHDQLTHLFICNLHIRVIILLDLE